MKRFWDKVQRGGINECWEWQAAMHDKGYGVFALEQEPKWRMVYAHRMAAYLSGIVNSPLAPIDRKGNGFVRHACDNRRCCNPAHLLVGTAADNTRDMLVRNRRGPRPPLSVEHKRKVSLAGVFATLNVVPWCCKYCSQSGHGPGPYAQHIKRKHPGATR